MSWTQADIDAAKCRMGSVKESLTVRARFFVQGEPKAQPRPKARRVKNFVQIYTPTTAKEWKQAIVKACLQNAPKCVLTSPIRLSIVFYMPRPKSDFKSNGQLKSNAQTYHTKKPDIDNLAKAVMDAISDSGVIWHDDKQVCSIGCYKVYGYPEELGAEIKIQEVFY